MKEGLTNFNLVIDFDSTFIKLEALDELAKIALSDDSKKEEKIQKVEKITNQGMLGELSFPVSLSSRLQLFNIKRKHIQKLVKKLEVNISESFSRNRKFFLNNKENIYIISGGFLDYILPIVEKFGISKEHILANQFIFKEDSVVGFDETNYLSQTGGKIKAIENLGIKNVVVVGDGWTDYEIKKAGKARLFIAFSENVRREKIVGLADLECTNFEGVIDNLSS